MCISICLGYWRRLDGDLLGRRCKGSKPSLCLERLLGSAGKEVIVMNNLLWLKKGWVRRKILYKNVQL